jgi:hypothetical protein
MGHQHTSRDDIDRLLQLLKLLQQIPTGGWQQACLDLWEILGKSRWISLEIRRVEQTPDLESAGPNLSNRKCLTAISDSRQISLSSHPIYKSYRQRKCAFDQVVPPQQLQAHRSQL